MTFNPFFEPENMSDEDLSNRLIELRGRLFMGSYSQSSPQLLQSLQDMIMQCEEVQAHRMQLQAQEAWDKMFPDIIESDPEEKQKRQEEEAATKITGKPGPKKRLASQEIFHKEYLNQPTKKDEGTK